MIKLPLEELLEKGLAQLGGELGRRIYSEEIRAGAEVDNALGRQSIADYKQKLAEASEHGVLTFLKEMVEGKLSPEQIDLVTSEGEDPWFFTRKGNYKNWEIEYTVDTEENLGSYQEHADKLIKEGKVCFQHIGLSFHPLSVGIFINDNPSKPNTIDVMGTNIAALLEDDLDRPDYREVADYIRNKMKEYLALQALNGKPFDPEKLSAAVINFIKY